MGTCIRDVMSKRASQSSSKVFQRSVKRNSSSRGNQNELDNLMKAMEDDEIEITLPPFHKGQLAIFTALVFLFTAHVTITIWPLWALMNSAVSTPALAQIFFFKGIFVQCAQYMPGQFQCDNFLRPVFSLSAF